MNTFDRLLADNRNNKLFFHILNSNRTLSYGDYRKVLPGKELKAKATYGMTKQKYPLMCKYGMHASKYIQDAQMFRSLRTNIWVCLVKLWGNVQHGDDKSVGMRRKVVAMRQLKEGDMEKIIKAGRLYNKFGYNYYFMEWVLANPWDGKDGVL